MTEIRKVVATVEEMDNERKIKLGFSSIIDREDVDKTDGIVAVNNRLPKYYLRKGLLFVDNSTIDGTSTLNGQVTSI